jgi:hypothetical protein
VTTKSVLSGRTEIWSATLDIIRTALASGVIVEAAGADVSCHLNLPSPASDAPISCQMPYQAG